VVELHDDLRPARAGTRTRTGDLLGAIRAHAALESPNHRITAICRFLGSVLARPGRPGYRDTHRLQAITGSLPPKTAFRGQRLWPELAASRARRRTRPRGKAAPRGGAAAPPQEQLCAGPDRCHARHSHPRGTGTLPPAAERAARIGNTLVRTSRAPERTPAAGALYRPGR
jgi:hypothetical protein